MDSANLRIRWIRTKGVVKARIKHASRAPARELLVSDRRENVSRPAEVPPNLCHDPGLQRRHTNVATYKTAAYVKMLYANGLSDVQHRSRYDRVPLCYG